MRAGGSRIGALRILVPNAQQSHRPQCQRPLGTTDGCWYFARVAEGLWCSCVTVCVVADKLQYHQHTFVLHAGLRGVPYLPAAPSLCRQHRTLVLQKRLLRNRS